MNQRETETLILKVCVCVGKLLQMVCNAATRLLSAAHGKLKSFGLTPRLLGSAQEPVCKTSSDVLSRQRLSSSIKLY